VNYDAQGVRQSVDVLHESKVGGTWSKPRVLVRRKPIFSVTSFTLTQAGHPVVGYIAATVS
jgi:hypothetical protein